MELNFFFAKQKHRMYKIHLKAFLIGLDQDLSDEIKDKDSTTCQLGQWIKQNANSKLSNFQEFKELAELHDKFHEKANTIITFKKEDQILEAKEEFKKLENISDTLLYLLTEIEKQIDIR